MSVKEAWQKLLFNHAALNPQVQHARPERSRFQISVRMTSPQAFSVYFYFVVVITKQVKGWIFYRLCQNQSFKKVEKISF